MKFRTRLLITSILIIVVPLLLTAVAFMGIGIYMVNSEQEYSLSGRNYTSFTYTLENYNQMTEEVIFEIQEQLRENSACMEDIEYLEEIDNDLASKSSYIIVRKNNEIYYTGNPEAAEQIFNLLPGYGSDASY